MSSAGKKKKQSQINVPQQPVKLKTPPPQSLARMDLIQVGNFQLAASKIFRGSLVIMGIFLLAGALRMGVAADEPIDYGYGTACLHYFTSFGKDTSYAALKVDGVSFPDQKYYGAAFEMIAPAINSLLKPPQPFTTHHLLCALAGIVLLLYTGLLAERLKGWTAGVLALWIIFLTPVISGNAFFNSKDIPFAAAFAAGIYYLLLGLENPSGIKGKVAAGLGAAVFAAIAIRISGVLLPAYVVLCTAIWYWEKSKQEKNRKHLIKSYILPVTLSVAAGTVAAFITYPNFWHEGMQHVTNGLAATKKFPHRIHMLYNDKLLSNQKLDTTSYLFKFIYMSVPELVLVGFALAVIVLILFRKKFRYSFDWMLLFAAIFPFAYVMIIKAPVYNGWRHLIFAYPFVAVITSIGLVSLLQATKQTPLRYVFLSVLVIALLDLMVWQIRAFPYNYVYYNHLSGGLAKIYKHYDTDYQQLATHEGVEWLLANEPVSGKKITVLSNNARALQREYDSTQVKFKYIAIKDMWMTDWDYAVISTIFLSEKAVDAMFPPRGTLHTIDRFGVPLSFVVARQSREDLTALRMIQHDSLKYAGSEIQLAYDANKTNTMAWYWKASSLFVNGNYQESLALALKYDQCFPGVDYNWELIAFNYYRLNDFQKALDFLNVLSKKNPQKRNYYQLIGDCLTNLGHPDQAQQYYRLAQGK